MKKMVKVFVGALVLAAAVTACSYGSMAITPSNKAIVLRNDGFLMGALRKAYVCDVSDAGLSNCQASAEKP
ncbi:MAG: hypothetical protein JXX14_12780 [Deltaproteobacteria bacterium]|nr:hypothetical protein [Deltaproteobacteria bacterium]